MDVKLFEVRDIGTLVPVMAVRLRARDKAEWWLLGHAGYVQTSEEQAGYVVLWRLIGGSAEYDRHAWGGRTMPAAHGHIQDNWDKLASGDVVDVRVVLGEAEFSAKSEREDER